MTRSRMAASAAAGLALLIALAGCSGEEAPPAATSPNPTAAPTPTTEPPPTPEEEAEAAAASAAFDVYQTATALDLQAYADPSRDWETEYRLLAGDPFLNQQLLSLAYYRDNGLAFRGRPSSDPEVAEVQLAPFGQVTIRDCFDIGDWVPVNTKTGQVFGEQPVGEYVIVSLVTRYDDGRWLVSEQTPYPDQPC
ncbi:MAG: hypothetical protein ACR2JK_17850 [Geodermatophilaceae bacterium]